MKIRIFQINTERDKGKAYHQPLENLKGKDPDPSIYDEVFNGEVDCQRLEEIVDYFACYEHPLMYGRRYITTSDVVCVSGQPEIDENGSFYCQPLRWEKVLFNPHQVHTVPTMQVVVVEPNKEPKVGQMRSTLDAMQKVVGGYITDVMLKGGLHLICNDEGIIQQLPRNRLLDNGTVILGTFFVCGEANEDFCGLSNEQSEAVMKMFAKKQQIELTYRQLKEMFRAYNQVPHDNGECMKGYVVISEDSFTQKYSLQSRTYEIFSDCKAFQPDMNRYSIFGTSLDKSDINVRLDQYLTDEKGGKNGWKIEKCYIIANPLQLFEEQADEPEMEDGEEIC